MQRPELLLLGLALRPDLAPQRETCPDRASARPANDTELAVSFSSTSSALTRSASPTPAWLNKFTLQLFGAWGPGRV